MKVQDSGMPEENIWNSFFDIPSILSKMEITIQIQNLVEIGSGYGTFTIPTANIISGDLYAFDIESEMLTYVKEKQHFHNLSNIILEKRDILTETTGLKNNSIDYFMLFNILHNEKPTQFLEEAYRILKPGGKIGIIHWRKDIETPRGPELSIRPTPEQIIKIVDLEKFTLYKKPFLLKPYHYGLILIKK